LTELEEQFMNVYAGSFSAVLVVVECPELGDSQAQRGERLDKETLMITGF